jgi:flagellar secretion chaperone FliS
MNAHTSRDRYMQDAVATASPARLLTMLYDRYVRDLTGAELAIIGGEYTEANAHLLHAQDIVMELRTTLDVSVWKDGAGLSELYSYMYQELVQANIRKDSDRVAAVRRLVEPLRDAWHEAALIAASASPGMAKAG